MLYIISGVLWFRVLRVVEKIAFLDKQLEFSFFYVSPYYVDPLLR